LTNINGLSIFIVQNAVIVASLMLITQCMIAEKPEEKGAGGSPGKPFCDGNTRDENET